MGVMQLLQIVWARRLLFVSIFALIVAAVVAASVLMPKKYLAQAAVVVDATGGAVMEESKAAAAQMQPTFLATQVDVIASHNVALKVVDDLHLDSNVKFKEAFAEAESSGSIRDWIADRLLNSLNVRSSRNGNVIFLEYVSKDPHFAAQLAEAFANSYIKTALELKVEPARRQAEWFDKQAQSLRVQFEAAQQKVADYQAQHGLIGVDDSHLDVENTRLEELSNQLVLAQATASANSERARQMEQAGNDIHASELNDVLNSPLLQNLKTELARAEGKFADVSQRFDRNHPQYMSAAAELAALQKKVASEIQNTRATVMREASISRQQAANLQKAMEEQRARIIALRGGQDDYTTLKREAENARTAYDTALRRNSETGLESRLDYTNIAILNHAVTPDQPASPRLMLNLALALLLGPLLAAALVVGIEMQVPTVHGREELFAAGLGPLLAEVPPAGITRRTAASVRQARKEPSTQAAKLQTEPTV